MTKKKDGGKPTRIDAKKLKPCPFCGGGWMHRMPKRDELEAAKEKGENPPEGLLFMKHAKDCPMHANQPKVFGDFDEAVFGMNMRAPKPVKIKAVRRYRITAEVFGVDTYLGCGHVIPMVPEKIDYCPKCHAEVIHE